MYYYILDPTHVPQKQFERQQAELHTLLTEFKINGESARVTPLRLIQDLVDIAASRGASTLIACGTDETFHQMLVALKGREFTLGFVPFVPKTQLGRILGLNDIPTCAKTIASRRIERLDLARLNDSYFISYLEIGIATETNKDLGLFSSIRLFAGTPMEIEMRIDDSYTIGSKMMGALIVNTRGTQTDADGKIGNHQDGFLDLLIVEQLGKFSAAKHKNSIVNGTYENIPNSTVIRCQKIEILRPTGLKIYMDGKETARAPATVEIIPNRLKMIVGKKRTF